MGARQMMLVFVMAALTAAAVAPFTEAQPGQRTFVRAIVGQLPQPPINPLVLPSIPRANLLLFESLISYTADLRPRGQLAERWDVSDDGLTYTFYLRRGVKWHDGRPFTADDVVFTAQAALDERNLSKMRPYYRLRGQSVRVEKIDEGTVRFTLPSPAAEFLFNLSQWNVIVPKHRLDGVDLNSTDFNTRPIGTGPFRFVQLRENQSIRLAANPSFHFGRPKIDIWIDRGFDDQLAALAALANGDVDVAPLDSRFAVDIARRFPHLKLYGFNPGWIYAFNMNLKASFFGDVRVRQALSYAIDRDALVRTAAGDAPVAWSLIGPPTSWAYNPNVPRYPKDVEKARQLLREAGFRPGPGGVIQKDGTPFRFTVLIEENPTDADSEALAAGLILAFRGIGVDMRVERLDKRSLERTVFLGREFDAYLWYNGYNFDPDPGFYWHSRNSANNYDDPGLDRLIDQANAAVRLDVRKQLLDTIAMKIAKEAAFIPLYYFTRYVAARDTVTFPSPSGADFSNMGVLYDVHTIEKTR
jgi:peptide/nickel transport system substrate-binding protein